MKGRCKYCGKKIHIHHLLVEIITPIILITLFWKYGTDLILFAKYTILLGMLIPIFFIDLYHRLILDKLTIPLAIIGLLFSLLPASDISFLNALLSCVIILVLMLFIAWVFEKIRHKEGMGGGDIKLLAAIAAFTGALNIAYIILFSSIVAVVTAVMNRRTREQGIPYGPFLAVATLIWILVGDYILSWYFNLL